MKNILMTQRVTVVSAGILAGGALSLWTLFEGLLGFHTARIHLYPLSQNISLLFLIIAISTMLKDYLARRKTSVPFSALFFRGVGLSALAGAVHMIALYLYAWGVQPTFGAQLQAYVGDIFETSSLSAADAAVYADAYELAFSPFFLGVQALFSAVIIGIIVSAITAMMLTLLRPKDNHHR